MGREQHDDKWLEGAKQLLNLGLVTRMDHLLESPEPVKLLMVANTRQSTSSRAPAIMSALGITDWYNPEENAHRQQNKADLVLECYPFAFVKEAATKIGARFYASEVKKSLAGDDKLNHSTKGSMMPFTSKIGWFAPMIAMPATYGYTSDDHPAVNTWTIQLDGSVEIRQAGILASTDIDRSDESYLRVFDSKKDGTPVRFIDLVNNLPKGMCMFAVSLFKSSGWQKGVLLRGHRKHLFSSILRLVKSGTFVIPDFVFPPTTTVNWLAW